MISRPQKVLIYLDQNFLSEMAKPAHARVRPDFRELYSILHEGFWNEQLVVLRSRFHEIETSLAGLLKDPIRKKRSTLGHVATASQWDIRERQIVSSLKNFVARDNSVPVICHDDAFEDKPDARVGHFDITVDMNWAHVETKEKRQRHAAELDTVRQRIRDNSISYEEQFAVEMGATRRDALQPHNAHMRARSAGVTDEQYRQFVASKAFAEVPVIWLEVSLLTRVMTAHSTRAIKEGDTTDIDAMATYLPYCDIYGADRFMAEVARSIKVPGRYQCDLFDSGKEGVAHLIEHLSNALSRVTPVNVPDLSIFVTAADSIKSHAFSFFHKIGMQAKKAHNQFGAWIEVFGFDDGRMPQYELKQVPGVAAPFFGLQEVVTIACTAREDAHALIDAARKRCRSKHFVFIDAYQDLPDDFIAKALMMPKDGESNLLGYRVYSRT